MSAAKRQTAVVGLDLQDQPQSFNPYGDPASLAERWGKFVRSFKFYVDGKGVTNPFQKYSLLLHSAGEEVQDIFETLNVDIDSETGPYSAALNALNAYFLPRHNHTYERHLFRQMSQDLNETTDQFCTRLRTKAKNCGFDQGATDGLIKDQLIQGMRSLTLKRKFLEKGDEASLSMLLDQARTHETASRQAASMELPSAQPRHHVNRINTNAKKTPTSEERRSCYRCGRSGHLSTDSSCPAHGKTCSKCGKLSHFAKMCRSSAQGQAKTTQKTHTRSRSMSYKNSNKAKVHSVEEGPDDHEDEYVFGVSDSYKADRVKVMVGGVTVDMIIDSGASVNVIGAELWEKMKADGIVCMKRKPDKNIYSYGSKSPMPLLGKFIADVYLSEDLELKSNCYVNNAEFYVTTDDGPALMGKQLAISLGVLTLGKVNFLSFKDKIVAEFPKCFEGVGKLKDYALKLKIDPQVTPKAQKMFRIPFSLREKVENKLDELEAMDIIERVNSASEWVSPLLVVPKQDGKDIRLVVDMRAANEAVIRERQPIPTVEEVLHAMNGAKVFSKLDLKYGYHQVELHPSSREITTFITHKGLYRYRRLIFGINAAAEKYQHIISQLLHDIEGAQNISDDIVVFGENAAEHDRRLLQVMQKLSAANLTLNKEKCQFQMDRITFMGHILSEHGIGPTEERVKDLTNAPRPKNAAEVKSFLGLVNFSARFIKDLATKAHPLRELCKKNTTFHWGKEEETSFRELRNSLTNVRTLGHFSLKADHTQLITDASNVGIGAVFVQESGGVRKVISYASRALNDVEKRYSTTEKEALAAVWGCEKFHIYLYATEFELVVDHKALEFIFSSKSRPSARIQRWALRLMPYKFTVKAIPGQHNVADAMSRLVNTDGQDTKLNLTRSHVEWTEKYINFVTKEAVPSAMTFEEVEQVSKDDVELKDLRRNLSTNIWEKSNKLYFPMRDELCCLGNVVLRGTRIVIPKELRSKCLKLAHLGHLGIVNTKHQLRTKVWWPGIDKDVENLIKACHSCQLVGRPSPPEPLEPTELPSGPWQDIGIDFLGPLDSGHYILVVIDYYSRYYEAEMTKKTTSEKVIDTLERLFAMHGIPRTLRSDNAANFTSDQFEEFLRENGILHRRSTPLHPEANGEVERQNRSLIRRIKIAKSEGRPYGREIRKYLFAYRTTPHSTTGKSPAEMMFGRKLRTRLPELEESRLDEEERDKDKIMKQKYKMYADERRHAKESNLEVGGKVLVKQRTQSKTDTPFNPKPFTLINKNGNSCVIESNDGIRYKRNSTHLKKYFESQDNGGFNDTEESTGEITSANGGLDACREKGSVIEAEPMLSKPSLEENVVDRPTGKRERSLPSRFRDYVMK